MLTKLITLITTLIFGATTDVPPLGSYDVPPAKSGKGAKVIPKEKLPNPLDYPPGIDPPYYPPVPTPPRITEL